MYIHFHEAYSGEIMTTYPAQINAIKWEKAKEIRSAEYTEQWVEKTDENKWDEDYDLFSDIRITEIYSNCFFAKTVIPFPYEIKLNGKLSDEWCVGDQVICSYENTYYDEETHRVEADFTDVKVSTFQLEEGKAYKPVIYLYPEQETEVSVELDLNGKLTCTYPEYKDGWKVTAAPDGMLMYGKEASNRKQEIDRQHYTIPNQRPKDKHCGKSKLLDFPTMPTTAESLPLLISFCIH